MHIHYRPRGDEPDSLEGWIITDLEEFLGEAEELVSARRQGTRKGRNQEAGRNDLYLHLSESGIPSEEGNYRRLSKLMSEGRNWDVLVCVDGEVR